ncbi:MAG: hypothetical protein FWE99_06140 [Bacteroidales bacterium]|nr:hypothetical protein [Bacteroidales bacterium]
MTKHILLILGIALITSASLGAQSPSGRAYPTGIYIFCGKEIPRNFYYLIEKKEVGGQWEQVAQLRAPQNAAALQANMLNLPAYIRQTMPLPLDQSDYIYTRQSKSFTTDSLYFYANDPKVLAAVGCGWFDDGLTASGTYQYRVSRVFQSGPVVLGEISQRFPQNDYRGSLEILQFKPEGEAVTLYYGLSDSISTHSLKLFRSRFLANDYRETPSSTVYANLKGRTVAVVQDESVVKGAAYSYMAIPYDHIGNMGMPSDTINVYNLTKVNDIGFASDFKAVADKEKGGVNLSWKIDTDLFVQGYELYRSKDYDIGYEQIAVLPNGTTNYFDPNLDPAEPYFYFVIVNNGFGASIPSARVPVILEGDQPNVLPPQNLTATLRENLVELTFHTIESDTRSYQIFRGDGYTGELTLIASFEAGEAPTGALVTFVDTLARSTILQTYSYAVADVNSSYKISPISERVSIQYSGGMLPIPLIIEAQLRGDRILVVWEDVSDRSSVVGYHVWRSALDNGGVTVEESRIVATLPYNQNSYIDSLLIPGVHYRYALESIGFDGETSSQSMHAGVMVPQRLPLSPGQVSAIASDRVMLSWDNPLDPSITGIRIYRTAINEQASLLTTLPADQTTFEDRTAKRGIQYFYYIVTVNNRNQESKPDEPVSARIR